MDLIKCCWTVNLSLVQLVVDWHVIKQSDTRQTTESNLFSNCEIWLQCRRHRTHHTDRREQDLMCFVYSPDVSSMTETLIKTKADMFVVFIVMRCVYEDTESRSDLRTVSNSFLNSVCQDGKVPAWVCVLMSCLDRDQPLSALTYLSDYTLKKPAEVWKIVCCMNFLSCCLC